MNDDIAQPMPIAVIAKAKRPSGQGLIGIGLAAMAAGAGLIVLWFLAAGLEFVLVWIGGVLINLGLLIWALGMIVRAIFFLPGRVVEPEQFWSGE